MKTLNSLGDLARAFEQNAMQIQVAIAAAMKTCAIAVVAEAKGEIGESGKSTEWPELSDSTKAAHACKGYDEDAPLVASGALSDSIQYKSSEKSFEVGSDSQIAVYQELGTATIPPRPFLAPALQRRIPTILESVGKAIEKSLAGEK